MDSPKCSMGTHRLLISQEGKIPGTNSCRELVNDEPLCITGEGSNPTLMLKARKLLVGGALYFLDLFKHKALRT